MTDDLDGVFADAAIADVEAVSTDLDERGLRVLFKHLAAVVQLHAPGLRRALQGAIEAGDTAVRFMATGPDGTGGPHAVAFVMGRPMVAIPVTELMPLDDL